MFLTILLSFVQSPGPLCGNLRAENPKNEGSFKSGK